MSFNFFKYKEVISEEDFSQSLYLESPTFKIAVTGDKEVGLSTFRDYYLKKKYNDNSRLCIGVNFDTKEITIMGIKIKLQWWIYSLEGRFRFLIPTYLRGSDLIIFMYDITNRNTLTKILTIEREPIPIVLVGNKLDRNDEREITAEEVTNEYRDSISAYVEISSQTGENIDLFFELIARYLIHTLNINMREKKHRNSLQNAKIERRVPR